MVYGCCTSFATNAVYENRTRYDSRKNQVGCGYFNPDNPDSKVVFRSVNQSVNQSINQSVIDFCSTQASKFLLRCRCSVVVGTDTVQTVNYSGSTQQAYTS